MNPSNENCCASDGNSCSPSPSVFANKVELEAAVNEWVSDATAAEAVHGPLPEWDVSFVLDLDGLFKSKGDFNGDISKWDTSKVTSMHSTFQRTAFNQPLVWDTSQVTNMGAMFFDTTAFNQPLDWDTSKVSNMGYMFFKADDFDQALDWDTTLVTDFFEFGECNALNPKNPKC